MTTPPPSHPAAGPFFTAEWSNLLIVSYRLPEAILRDSLPAGLDFDAVDLPASPHAPGTVLVSLVCFDFARTRLRGLPIPFHTSFPEINLRFYVRDPHRRGVCFARELVPRPAVSIIARAWYNEPYRTLPIRSSVTRHDGLIRVEHRAGPRREHLVSASADDRPFLPDPGSAEHWFKEHEWGFGRSRRGHTLVYRVEHPPWRVFPNPVVTLRLRFDQLFADAFSVLADTEPCSVVLAEGSPVSVFPASRL